MPTIGVHWRFLDDELAARLKNNPAGYPVRFFDAKDPEPAGIADCELLFTDCGADVLQFATSLRWLSTPMAGAAQYCKPGLLPADAALTNSAGAYGTAISEHMLTLTLMLLRRMDEYMAQQNERGWGLIGRVRTLQECRVAVVGMGDIGSAYAQRMRALGAKVRGVRRTVHEQPDYVEKLYAQENLDEALQDADIVALALPGTKETENILNRKRLESLKPGCIVINVGRGSLIDQNALGELLRTGRLGGAGLDVCTPEPLPKDDPLWDAPRLILTPHVSGMNSCGWTLHRILDMYFENLLRWKEGKPLLRQVNRELGY